MSRKGQRALQRIAVEFNTMEGDGMEGLRHAFAREIPAFQSRYPDVAIEVRRRQRPEPWVTGFYRDGSEKVFNLQDLSAQAVALKFYRLANDSNDVQLQYRNTQVYRERHSAQGNWNPYLWMAERSEARVDAGNWDRELSEGEWEYYVQQFSDQMEAHEGAVQGELAKRTDLPSRHTDEVKQRWGEHVAPHMQTDLEHNVAHFKKSAAKGQLPDPVRFGEYDLFTVPDNFQMGTDAVHALRTREAQALEKWWKSRKEQLKPPA